MIQSVMWQLSFPMPEEDAKALSSQGQHLKKKPVAEHNGTIQFRKF
jgi:hypothetical protein